MSYANQMLQTYPRESNVDRAILSRCIQACFDCAQASTACADDCLSEGSVADLIKCIRTNQDCADVCIAAGRVLSRQTEYDASLWRAVLEACAQACRTCGDECAEHAEHGMEHCRVCAEACTSCEQACQELLPAIGA